jgi:hypothetical protein
MPDGNGFEKEKRKKKKADAPAAAYPGQKETE